jgi:hypothetical protein
MKLRMTLFKFICFTCLTVSFIACKKEKNERSVVPEIRLVDVSPLQIKEYKDKIMFNLFYQDGDGDIGENNDAVKNLFITDSRNGITYQYRIKQLSPDGAEVSIEGNLMVELNSTGILNGASSEPVNYSIYLTDRAGNSSNTVVAEGLMIIK